MDFAGRSLSIVQNRARQNCVWEGERRLVHRARQSRCIDARRTGLREMTQSPSHAPGFARTTFYSPLFVPFARVSLFSPTSPGSSHKFNAKVKTSTTRSRVGRDTRSLGEEVAVCVCACVCRALSLIVCLFAGIAHPSSWSSSLCRFIVYSHLPSCRVSRALFLPVSSPMRVTCHDFVHVHAVSFRVARLTYITRRTDMLNYAKLKMCVMIVSNTRHRKRNEILQINRS